MIIEKIEITGLNGSEAPITILFNHDINIITGRNGSGKTTLLKLMWYCISGNIERAIDEIQFHTILVTTKEYSLKVEKQEIKFKKYAFCKLMQKDGSILFEEKEPIHRGQVVHRANEETIKMLNTSIFFPTFRRIEGGFSMDPVSQRGRGRRISKADQDFYMSGSHSSSSIQDALEGHADMLSVGNHKFISSISTIDIQRLITKQHNAATLKVDNFSKSLSENIFSEIKSYKNTNSSDKDALKDAVSTLDKINQDVTEFEQVREKEFNSLTVLSNIIVSIFKHKGIQINPRVTLGDIHNSINSELLSAGEKQMLSFLCYNALYTNCPIFIDEPELSLHVDWQRILLDVMIEQKTNNQLFIATHSPFIYTQFEDKEIMIDSDRGHNIEY